LGWVQTFPLVVGWVGLGRVSQLMGWVGSGHTKWTNGQLWSGHTYTGPIVLPRPPKRSLMIVATFATNCSCKRSRALSDIFQRYHINPLTVFDKTSNNRKLSIINTTYTTGFACEYQGCPSAACCTFSRNASASGPVNSTTVIYTTRV